MRFTNWYTGLNERQQQAFHRLIIVLIVGATLLGLDAKEVM